MFNIAVISFYASHCRNASITECYQRIIEDKGAYWINRRTLYQYVRRYCAEYSEHCQVLEVAHEYRRKIYRGLTCLWCAN